jgi:hypothetical protein
LLQIIKVQTQADKMITEQEYNDAEEQYISLTDKKLGKLAEQAAEEQPALFVYVATYYDFLQEDDSKDFFLQLIYSTWIAYTNKYELKRKLTVEDLEKMEEADEKLINDLSGNEDAIVGEALKRMTKHPQAALIGCIYIQIGEYFELDQVQDEFESDNPHHQDAGIISGVINSFVNLLEKARNILYAT